MPRPGKLPETEQPTTDTEKSVVWSIEVDGEVFDGRAGSWSWRDEHEMYVMSGLGWPRCLAEIRSGNVAPFFVACLVFLSRRAAGEAVSFDDVQNSIDADSLINTNYLPPTEPKPRSTRRKDPAPEDQGSS